MFDKIYTFVSDPDLIWEKILSLMERKLWQKFLYFNNWADLYYKIRIDDPVYKKSTFSPEIYTEFLESFLQKKPNAAIVSLWCWNSKAESSFLEKRSDLSDLSYVWIDLSYEMLQFSINSMQDIKLSDKKFVRADFWSGDFNKHLNNLTRNKIGSRIFSFFSNTLWNIPHTNIVDTLYNLSEEWEYVRVDVRLRSGLTSKDDLNHAKMMKESLMKEARHKFYINVIQDLWIPEESWELIISTNKEPSIKALRFHTYFYLTSRVELKINWKRIIILPGEKISIVEQYLYDTDWLIEYFYQHNFSLVKQSIQGLRWMFLFERNKENHSTQLVN